MQVREMRSKLALGLVLLVVAFSLSLQGSVACTEVLLNRSKGIVISGRTLDYGTEMASRICFKAKGAPVSDPGLKFTQFTTTPLAWTAKYNVVLVDGFNEPAYIDGMNSEGLSVGTLWDIDTEPACKVDPGTQGLANVSLVEYILENAKDVQEARELMSHLSVFLASYKGTRMTLHWIVTDKTGKSLVMELRDGHPRFFDQSTQVGVMTNAPSYDKQLAGLRAFEEGGNSPLPGDYKPTSRFIKSAFLVSHLPEFKNTEDAVVAATQILHNVESPKGAQGPGGSFTQWLVVRDQINLRYILMGVRHPAPKVVDLQTVDFQQLAGKRLAVDDPASGNVATILEKLEKRPQGAAATSD